MIDILLADDHPVVLEGFKLLLGGEADFRVVGEATDGLSVAPLIDKARPGVLVVDLMMPGLGGLEVVRQVHARWPEIRIAVLSMHANEAYVFEAFKNGASAYVLKQAPARALVEAIRAIAAGRRYLSPPLDEDKVAEYELRTRSATVDLYDTLSTREREVLKLAAEGLTNAVIGERLKIGKRTVETHRANLIRKLDLKSQADLVRFALKRGLVSAD